MKKLLYTAAAIFALGAISSCKKFLDVNTNPNAPVTTDASNLMPPMLAGMERGVWFDSRYVGQYTQQWGASGTDNVWDREGYIPANDAAGEMWRTHYFSLGANIRLMRNDALAKKNYDYVGASYAMLAWSWQNSVDLYNNMPLKEAFDETKLTFNYDEPQDIYAEVISECKTALNYFYLTLQNGQPDVSSNFARGDYMYYGDRRKWLRFTYAVMAVNASHLSNKSTYNPDLVVKYVDSSFTSNADNATIQNNGTQSGDSNFWGTVRQNLNSFRQSDFMVRLLDGRIFTGATNYALDPRLPLLLTASGDGQYRGVVASNGDPNALDPNTSVPYLWGVSSNVTPLPAANLPSAKYIFRDDARGVLITYSMLQFIKAEALFRKGDKAGALAAYKIGIGSSIDFVSSPPSKNLIVGGSKAITDAAKAAYLSSAAVKQDANSLQMSDIMQQKFISLFGWGQLEAWADLRRFRYDTGIFQGFVRPGSLYTDNGGKQVYRVRPRYNSEYIWNIPSLQRIGALQPDYHTKEPWFILP